MSNQNEATTERKDMRKFWLENAIADARERAQACHTAYLNLTNKGTQFAQAIKTLRDAHTEAADVYCRILNEVPK